MVDLFPGYVIDTSALIDLWRRRYPRDVFPGLWQNIEHMIDTGELAAPLEVLNELQKQQDELSGWAKKQKCFMDMDSNQINYILILENNCQCL